EKACRQFKKQSVPDAVKPDDCRQVDPKGLSQLVVRFLCRDLPSLQNDWRIACARREKEPLLVVLLEPQHLQVFSEIGVDKPRIEPSPVLVSEPFFPLLLVIYRREVNNRPERAKCV